ncbi:MAG: biotin/lipoyl-containing protein, partial [Gemmatimonadales bacterium]
MALVDIIMPQMGESIAEGTVSKWLKKVGDEVKRDEPLFEISTDKVDAEIPASAAGVLAEILVQEGQTVEIQTVVARLETEKGAAVGTAAKKVAPVAAGNVPAAVASGGPPPKTESAPSPSQAQKPSVPGPAVSTPAQNGNSFEERVRTRSSPLVRKIAAEHGIDIT